MGARIATHILLSTAPAAPMARGSSTPMKPAKSDIERYSRKSRLQRRKHTAMAEARSAWRTSSGLAVIALSSNSERAAGSSSSTISAMESARSRSSKMPNSACSMAASPSGSEAAMPQSVMGAAKKPSCVSAASK